MARRKITKEYIFNLIYISLKHTLDKYLLSLNTYENNQKLYLIYYMNTKLKGIKHFNFKTFIPFYLYYKILHTILDSKIVFCL